MILRQLTDNKILCSCIITPPATDAKLSERGKILVFENEPDSIPVKSGSVTMRGDANVELEDELDDFNGGPELG